MSVRETTEIWYELQVEPQYITGQMDAGYILKQQNLAIFVDPENPDSITKTSLFKYTENFTTKKMQIFR